VSETMCHSCQVWMDIPFDSEPTKFCHDCAQTKLLDAEELLTELLPAIHQLRCYDAQFYERNFPPTACERIKAIVG
jgi:hypothetical protein